MYKPGDVVQYEKGRKAESIERGSFAVVRLSDGPINRLTVELGSTVACVDFYSKGQLGRDAHAVPILVEKEAGSRRRAEAYEQGDKIQYKTGSSAIHHIPHDTTATVLSMMPGPAQHPDA